jgi:DNA repair exonuclease SbcCD ATPase subunit
MKILSLTLSGYRQFADRVTLILPQGLTGIYGSNGVGKSKIVEAIGYALYGPKRVILPKGDKLDDIPSKGRAGALARVELTIEVRKQVFEIVRSPRETYIRLASTIDPLAVGPSDVTRKVIELLHLSPAAYRGTFVARQNDIAGLQNEKPTHRTRLVHRLIGIEQVEKAIELIGEVCTLKRGLLRDAERALEITSVNAEQVLQEDMTAVQAAKLRITACESAQREAMAAHKQVLDIKAALDGRVASVSGKEASLITLGEYKATVQQQMKNEEDRIADGDAAARKLQAALQTLDETGGVDERLKLYDLMQRRAELLAKEQELESDLHERINPLLEERAIVQSRISKSDAIIKELSAKEAEYGGTCKVAASQLADARAAVAKYTASQSKIIDLGEAGVCESCGRSFGDDLDSALEHFAQKINDARVMETDADTRLQDAQSRQNDIRAQVADLRAGVDLDKQRLEDLEGIRDDDVRVRYELGAVRSELLMLEIDADDSLNAYDPLVHAQLRVDSHNRQKALTDKENLLPQLSAASKAREDLAELALVLAKIVEQEEGLTNEVLRLKPTAEEQEAYETQLAAADEVLEACSDALHDARESLGRAEERVEIGQTNLAKAIGREKIIEETRSDVQVAERTDIVYHELLNEITMTARPRLEELMDTWGRSLFGSRFHEIKLTKDYRIRADNGSGMHDIEHFSGGEQTLLALMLRVAIAVFCQQHIGFDEGFLILDEVFGNQDTERRALLVEFLNQIQDQFSQVIIINHIDDVTYGFDHLIDVVALTQNTSSVSVREYL